MFNLRSFYTRIYTYTGFPGGTVVKNMPANAGDTRDMGSMPGSERSPGGGTGTPLQYSCLGNPMDRGTWRATVHGVTKSQTGLKRLSVRLHTHIHTHTYIHSQLE